MRWGFCMWILAQKLRITSKKLIEMVVTCLLLQFGEIDIDSELVAFKETVEGDQAIMMLNNGCICCTVKDDLLDMLEELVQYLPHVT